MNITRGQVCGAITVALIATFFYSGRFLLHYFRPLHTISIPYIEKKTGSVIVELTGDTDHKGIYFVPPNTTVSNLFRIANVADTRKINRKDFSVILSNGEKVIIDSGQVKIGKIDAAKRITLDMPIDINNATAYDLSLIPGIGKKTAQAIVDLRRSTGGISSINDLLKMRGMGKKKFTKIKKYLTVNEKT